MSQSDRVAIVAACNALFDTQYNGPYSDTDRDADAELAVALHVESLTAVLRVIQGYIPSLELLRLILACETVAAEPSDD